MPAATFIDEVDTFGKDNPELHGVLNSGHARANAWVIRSGGDRRDPHRSSTWCPVAYAAIGKLPDTWMNRSIVIHMRRKKSSGRSIASPAKPRRRRFRRTRAKGSAVGSGQRRPP